MKKFLLLAGLLVAGSTFAGEAHVCKSQTVANSAANAELIDDTVLNVAKVFMELSRRLPETDGKLCSRQTWQMSPIHQKHTHH
ncbi:Uncharacterised protein [Salmonella enterica subsp. enterica]|nr:Uncharacterised protein [Salmonella enterica subsp. enterica]